MAEIPSADALAAEFDCDLRGQIALLHGRYGPEAEPSNVFRLGDR